MHVEPFPETYSGSTGYSDSGLLVSISGVLLNTPDGAPTPSWFVIRNNDWSETGSALPPIKYQDVKLDRVNCWDEILDHAICPLNGIYAIFLATRKNNKTPIHVRIKT